MTRRGGELIKRQKFEYGEESMNVLSQTQEREQEKAVEEMLANLLFINQCWPESIIHSCLSHHTHYQLPKVALQKLSVDDKG